MANVSALERSRSLLSLDPRSRYLPDVRADGYRVGSGEPLASALHRLTTEQFTIAIEALSDPKADIAIATVATLKSVARITAVLRLVRSSIGDEAYRTESLILRETSELLGGLLYGQPEMRALDQLRARYQPVLQPTAFADLRNQLLHRHQLHRLKALSEGEALQRTLQRLRRARARFAAWPIDDATDARMYGREPVSNSFAALADGLRRTYKRGRKQWRKVANGELEALPSWHREVRLLENQLTIMSSSWPEVIGATAVACGQLEAVLTEEAGLAELQAVIDKDLALTLDEVERSMLDSIASNARGELGNVALVLGGRLYVEAPEAFMERMEAYWKARGLSL